MSGLPGFIVLSQKRVFDLVMANLQGTFFICNI